MDQLLSSRSQTYNLRLSVRNSLGGCGNPAPHPPLHPEPEVLAQKDMNKGASKGLKIKSKLAPVTPSTEGGGEVKVRSTNQVKNRVQSQKGGGDEQNNNQPTLRNQNKRKAAEVTPNQPTAPVTTNPKGKVSKGPKSRRGRVTKSRLFVQTEDEEPIIGIRHQLPSTSQDRNGDKKEYGLLALISGNDIQDSVFATTDQDIPAGHSGFKIKELQPRLSDTFQSSVVFGTNHQEVIKATPPVDDIMVTRVTDRRSELPWTQVEYWNLLEIFLETRALCQDSKRTYREAELSWFRDNRVTESRSKFAFDRSSVLMQQSCDYENNYNSILDLLEGAASIKIKINSVSLGSSDLALSPLWKREASSNPTTVTINRFIMKKLKYEMGNVIRRFEILKILTSPIESSWCEVYRLKCIPFFSRILRDEIMVLKIVDSKL